LGISYSAVFAALMAVAGAVMLMARYKAISFSFTEEWEEEYQLAVAVEPAGAVVSTKVRTARKVTSSARTTATRNTTKSAEPKAKPKTPARKTVKSTVRTRKTGSK
jgi:hypothetical protein